MTKAKFTSSAAILAIIASLGVAAHAQTAPAQTTPATDAGSLPQPLSALNLGDLQIETKRDGLREIEGVTADGVKIEAMIDMAGNVLEIEADDGAVPQSLIEAYVPQAARDHAFMSNFTEVEEINLLPDLVVVNGNRENGDDVEAVFNRDNQLVKADFDDSALPAQIIEEIVPQAVRQGDIFAQFASVNEVGQMRDILVVKGQDAEGKGMGAAFDQDGRVLRFSRADDDHRRRGGKDRGERFGDKGPRGGDHRGGDHGDHGPRDGGPRDGGPRDGGPRDGGPRGHGPDDRGPGGKHGRDMGRDGDRGGDRGGDQARLSPAAPTGFDAVEVNKALSDAGYGNFGFLRPQGDSVLIEATNPQGEAVLLELGADGDVMRETAR